MHHDYDSLWFYHDFRNVYSTNHFKVAKLYCLHIVISEHHPAKHRFLSISYT